MDQCIYKIFIVCSENQHNPKKISRKAGKMMNWNRYFYKIIVFCRVKQSVTKLYVGFLEKFLHADFLTFESYNPFVHYHIKYNRCYFLLSKTSVFFCRTVLQV